MAPNTMIWKATCPPSVSRASGGPLNARAMALSADARAASSRSACVGYSCLTLDAAAAVRPPTASTHTAMRVRSRRANDAGEDGGAGQRRHHAGSSP